MKSATLSALFFAASIALAIAVPARSYFYEEDDDGYPGGHRVLAGRRVSLSSAPFFYQARTLEVEQLAPRGRKYQIVKRKKNKHGPQGSDEEENQDDESGSEESEEEDEEEDDENKDEEQEELDTPAWEEMFPEEDKNTGTFNTPGDDLGPGATGGTYSGNVADIPGGAPAPESGGSLMSLFSGGYLNPQRDEGEGGPGGPGGSGGPGGPPQYRQGPPPPRPGKRGRTALGESGSDVIFDGVRYIPVKPVHVQVSQRTGKKVKTKVGPKKIHQARTGVSTKLAKRQGPSAVVKNKSKNSLIFVPVDRANRELRFSRDQHQGFKVQSGPPSFAPSEIWRWEGPGGRPLRKRENRPSGLYYSPRPQRGSGSSVRFGDESY